MQIEGSRYAYSRKAIRDPIQANIESYIILSCALFHQEVYNPALYSLTWGINFPVTITSKKRDQGDLTNCEETTHNL